jgi:conjugation system TraG family ATPase
VKNTDKTILLKNKFPIWKIEKDYLISIYGDITVGFRLIPPKIFTLTVEDYDQIHQLFEKAIKLLPEYTVVHKQDWYTKEKYKIKIDTDKPEPSFLSRSFERHCYERPYMHHESYIYITKTSRKNISKVSLMTTLPRTRIVPAETLDETSVKNFIEAVEQFRSIISSSPYYSCEFLKETDYTNGLFSRYLTLSNSNDQNIIRDIRFEPEYIKVGDKKAHIFSLSSIDDLPQSIYSVSRFEPLSTDRSSMLISSAATVGMLLFHNHIYNQYIFVDSQKRIINKLESNVKHMTALSRFSRENAVNAEMLNAFLDEVHSSDARIIRAHANVIAWDDANTSENLVKNDTGAAIVAMNCAARHNTIDAPMLYWAGIPGNGADFPSEDSFITTLGVGLSFFTHETEAGFSLSPFGIKVVDRFTGRPLHIDISDEPMTRGIIKNRNKFIVGPSGSGKSFFTNHLVRQYYEQGTHVVLVDIGNSYLGLCNLINEKTKGRDGVYFTYTEENPISFNPFYTDDNVFDIEKLESIKTLITALWKKSEETLTNSERTVLSESISNYIKLLKQGEVGASFNDYFDFLYKKENQNDNDELDNLQKLICTLTGNEKTLTGYESAKRFISFNYEDFRVTLTPFYKGGQYDYLLNAKNNIDLLDKAFVVFELDNIKDNPVIFPVVTIIIMETFINKMRRLKGKRKMILIEEAWKAIAREGMAEYIKYLFKTVRKHFGEAVVVTQEIDDIMSSDIIKDTIVSDSDCKILLDQSKYMNRFEEIQRLLGLTDKQTAQVLSVNKNLDRMRKYKEVFISLGSTDSNVYAIEVSKEEYFTYTTEQKEKIALLDMADKKGGIENALKNIENLEI